MICLFRHSHWYVVVNKICGSKIATGAISLFIVIDGWLIANAKDLSIVPPDIGAPRDDSKKTLAINNSPEGHFCSEHGAELSLSLPGIAFMQSLGHYILNFLFALCFYSSCVI